MFEKVGQVAEQMATSVSRRQFLDKFGRSAMILAAAVGGLLILSADAQAQRPPHICGTGSSNSCLGLNEGDVCFTGPYSGRCRGWSRKSPTCYCDVNCRNCN